MQRLLAVWSRYTCYFLRRWCVLWSCHSLVRRQTLKLRRIPSCGPQPASMTTLEPTQSTRYKCLHRWSPFLACSLDPEGEAMWDKSGFSFFGFVSMPSGEYIKGRMCFISQSWHLSKNLGQAHHDLMQAVSLILTLSSFYIFLSTHHPDILEGSLGTCICSTHHGWVFCPLICRHQPVGLQQEQENCRRSLAEDEKLRRSNPPAANEHVTLLTNIANICAVFAVSWCQRGWI